jgi:hypothetical protein
MHLNITLFVATNTAAIGHWTGYCAPDEMKLVTKMDLCEWGWGLEESVRFRMMGLIC